MNCNIVKFRHQADKYELDWVTYVTSNSISISCIPTRSDDLPGSSLNWCKVKSDGTITLGDRTTFLKDTSLLESKSSTYRKIARKNSRLIGDTTHIPGTPLFSLEYYLGKAVAECDANVVRLFVGGGAPDADSVLCARNVAAGNPTKTVVVTVSDPLLIGKLESIIPVESLPSNFQLYAESPCADYLMLSTYPLMDYDVNNTNDQAATHELDITFDSYTDKCVAISDEAEFKVKAAPRCSRARVK